MVVPKFRWWTTNLNKWRIVEKMSLNVFEMTKNGKNHPINWPITTLFLMIRKRELTKLCEHFPQCVSFQVQTVHLIRKRPTRTVNTLCPSYSMKHLWFWCFNTEFSDFFRFWDFIHEKIPGSRWLLCEYRVMVQNQVWRRRKSLHLVSTKKNLPSDLF